MTIKNDKSYGQNVSNHDLEKYFIEIYEKYADAIYRYCFYRVSSVDMAEDITQEVFTRFWNYIKNGNEVREVKAFLYRISRNLVIDYYKKKDNFYKKIDSLDEMIENRITPASLSYDSHFDKIESNDLLREIFDVMKRLPETYKDLLVLRHVEELKVREIADIYSESPKNISAKIKRAEKKLSEVIKDIEKENKSKNGK